MKKILITVAAVVMLISVSSCGQKAENVVLQNQQDSISWAMGMSLARTVKEVNYKFDETVVRRAFESTIKGEKQPLDEESYNAIYQFMVFQAMQAQRNQAKTQSDDADKAQQAYFDKLVKENPNVKKHEEGFYYEVLKEGKGPKATAGLRIRFDFKGSNLLTGEVIDETYGHRDPIVHVLNQSIFKGLYYGLQLMNAGSKYRFYFPYQVVGETQGIPACTPVMYEVELHEIYKD